MNKVIQLFLIGFILTWLIVPSYYFVEINLKYNYLLITELFQYITIILLYMSYIGVIIFVISIIALVVISIKKINYSLEDYIHNVSRETL